MAVGVFAEEFLSQLAEMRTLQRVIVIGVMLLMAFPLKTEMIFKSIRHPMPALLATGVSFIVVPCLASLTRLWLDPVSAAGLLVVAATPCTLATAAVWTARAGGNDATALMTTVITNGTCFFVTPLLVWATLGRSEAIPVSDLSMQLLLMVLLPIVVGQSLRLRKSFADFATRNKTSLNALAQTGVLAMVLIGMVSTSQLLKSESGISITAIARIAAACLAIHLLALWIGFRLAQWMKMDRRDQIAVAFSGSQKTLMVGLFVCLLLEISPLPMVVYHAIQLIVDTLIADRFVAGEIGSEHLPVAR